MLCLVLLENSCTASPGRGVTDYVPSTNCILLFHNVMYYYITRQWCPQRVMYKTVVSSESAYVQMCNSDVVYDKGELILSRYVAEAITT